MGSGHVVCGRRRGQALGFVVPTGRLSIFPSLMKTPLLSGLALTLALLLPGHNGVGTPASAGSIVTSSEIPFNDPHEFPQSAYPYIANARVVWLGEMHGTNEAPALLLGLVRLISRNDRPPVVALEIPHDNQEAIDDFLKSGDQAALKTRTFFAYKPEGKDGRASQAMERLLEALRTEKIAKVVCIDPVPIPSGQRDEGMAMKIAEWAARFPSSKIVVLTGNAHAMITEGAPWDPKYQGAAFQLAKQLAPIATFDFRYESGTVWNRTQEGFGEHKIKDSSRPWAGSAPYYISFGDKPVHGYHGVIFSRAVSGSPPWP